MFGRVTMREIARKAGVHVTTVSLALRNNPSLPLATRQRLQALAQEMGYRPDPNLSALVSYRRKLRPPTTGTVLAYITNAESAWGWMNMPAHRDFFQGAGDKATQLGYRLEHFWLGEPGLTPRRLSGILRTRGINGAIFASHRPGAGTLQDIEWPEISAVKIDYLPREPALHMVTNDQSGIVRLAMRKALAAGYRRIGLVMPEYWDEMMDMSWTAGYTAEQQHLPPRDRLPILRYPSDFGPEHPGESPGHLVPRELFAKWLEKQKPDALLSRSLFVLGNLKPLGVAVPGDVGFADIYLDSPDGKTAGVRHNCARVGETAVELLVGQVQQNARGIPAITTTTFVEGTWFDGQSLPPRRPQI